MGGRGGGSGLGSNTAAGAKMPELTGSEKQVQWAKSLRDNFMQAADANVRNAMRNKALGLQSGTNIPSVEGAKKVRKDIVSTFQKITSASQIIDKRGMMTQNFLEKAGIQWDRENKRKK